MSHKLVHKRESMTDRLLRRLVAARLRLIETGRERYRRDSFRDRVLGLANMWTKDRPTVVTALRRLAKFTSRRSLHPALRRLLRVPWLFSEINDEFQPHYRVMRALETYGLDPATKDLSPADFLVHLAMVAVEDAYLDTRLEEMQEDAVPLPEEPPQDSPRQHVRQSVRH